MPAIPAARPTNKGKNCLPLPGAPWLKLSGDACSLSFKTLSLSEQLEHHHYNFADEASREIAVAVSLSPDQQPLRTYPCPVC